MRGDTDLKCSLLTAQGCFAHREPPAQELLLMGRRNHDHRLQFYLQTQPCDSAAQHEGSRGNSNEIVLHPAVAGTQHLPSLSTMTKKIIRLETGVKLQQIRCKQLHTRLEGLSPSESACLGPHCAVHDASNQEFVCADDSMQNLTRKTRDPAGFKTTQSQQCTFFF